MIELFGLDLGTPFQGGTFLAMLGIFGLVLRAYIAGMPARQKVAADKEANLLHERAEEMASMRERIAKLEEQQTNKDKAHAEEVKGLEEIQAAKDRYHEALRAADRHRMNNLNHAFASLLMLLKKGVAVEEAVVTIEALRAEQLEREAGEMATIRAAAIGAGIEGAEL